MKFLLYFNLSNMADLILCQKLLLFGKPIVSQLKIKTQMIQS